MNKTIATALKSSIAFLLCTFLTLSSYGQVKNSKISGTVQDSSGKALSYVTASLYKKGNLTTAVKSTYTNETGKFQFINNDTGSYTIILSHTGFAETMKDIEVAGTEELALGSFKLSASSGSMQGVTVTARKPLVEQTDDKIVFNVENDPMTKTETALDILRKTPFVSVDGDDNVQVNGQSNFKVLLNGRETAMFAQNVKEALKGFPGSMIVKIEVITSPSAKYDGEGVGGVINIITKKKVVGYNGSISANYSTMRWGNLNTNFSAKFGKFGMTLYYGAGGIPGKGQEGSSYIRTVPTVPSFYTQRLLTGKRSVKNFWNFGNAELNYEIDSLNTISAYGNVSGGSNSSLSDQVIYTDFPSSPSTTSYYKLKGKVTYPTNSIGSDYVRKFSNNKERELSIRFNTEFGTNKSFFDSEQDNPTDDRFIINESIAKNNQYTLQSDYVHPLKKNQKIEGGVKGIFRRASSDFNSRIKYDQGHDYKPNPANTDNFNYSQDIFSVYSSYSFKVKKTNFRLGARLEQTGIDGDFNSSGTKVKQDYTTLLPNVQASTKLSNSFTLVLNYNKRLQRPGIWDLNPFINNNDSLNISFGNPNLGPQTIHSFSTQTRLSKGATFAGLTFEVSYSGNRILQYASFDPSTGVTQSTSMNIGKEMQYVLSGNFSTKITPDWNVYLNGHVRYNKVSNRLNPAESNAGFSGNANLNTNYKINKRFNASAYAGFWRGPVSIQTTFPLNIWYGMGMGYKFFNEKLTLSLSASNFLQKNWDYRRVTTDPKFQTTSVTTLPFRGISLSVNWNFGKMTENVSKKKGVTNDDQLGNGQGGN